MKKIISVLIFCLLLVGCQNIQTEPQNKSQQEPVPFTTYSSAEFFQTTSIRAANSKGISFSPDMTKVLMSSDESGVFNAYAIDIESEKRQQLTLSDDAAIFALSYFPDDERLLYSSDGNGDELSHIWVRELGGTVKDLTDTEKTKARFLGWNSDYRYFYIATNERDSKAFDLYRYEAASYKREKVFNNVSALALQDISRDGRWLALVKVHTNVDSDVFIVDLHNASAEPELITKHQGNVEFDVYDFTPDNRHLIVSSNEKGEWNQALSYDLQNQTFNTYVSADWDVTFVGFSATGKYRYHGVNADAETKVFLKNVKSDKPLALPDLKGGNILNIRFSKDDSKMAFLLNGDTSPSNLYVMDIGSAPKRLTQSLNPAIAQEHMIESTIVRYASFDDTLIPSLLYKPKQASVDNKVPALVLVHGGPGGQTRKGYNAMVQHLVNHGYAVLGANNRGSSGYGKTFYHMDDKRHGEGDLQDIVMGRQYLESLDWVDPNRIGIIGGSYGGFMVAAALAFEPQAFNVGINIFGVTNWVRTLKSIPPWWESFKKALYDEMGDPATDEARHRSISPLFHAKNIVKPLLVVQGANDPRVLKAESDELVAAVKVNNTPVKYILFDDEGHGFRKRENRIAASDAYLSFLNEYLK